MMARWYNGGMDKVAQKAYVKRYLAGMEEVERIVIRRTLEQTKGDKNLAAQILGIAARTIYRKLDRDEEGRLLPGERDE